MIEPIVNIKIDKFGHGFHPIKEIPCQVTKATVHIDYSTREPVTVDLTLIGGIETEIAAGVRNIEIGGKKYRLVETDHVRPMPDSSAPQLHD